MITVNVAKGILRSRTLKDLISGETARGTWIKPRMDTLAFKFKVPDERMLVLIEAEDRK